MFFNPALYHGAGENTSADISRMANLLQISSPFGRAMESLDRTADGQSGLPGAAADAADGRPAATWPTPSTATAEGYAFPTNLDSDQPIGSLRPAQPGRHRAGRAGRRTQHSRTATTHSTAQNERRTP